MKLSDFMYDLPEERIAQTPVEPRDHSRLMVLHRRDNSIEHRHFYDIIDYLNPGDALVINETRVIPARLIGERPSGGACEILLLKQLAPKKWEAIVRPGKKLRTGAQVLFGGGRLVATIAEVKEDGGRIVDFTCEGTMEAALDELGEMPLPPYIHEKLADRERYQTVYAKQEGSAAAPTAGLHFTEELLDRIRAKGVGIASVDLEVGLGTFRTVTEEDASQHDMHVELYTVPQATVDAVAAAKAAGGRVIAVGTTSVRSLESAAAGGQLQPQERSSTKLFIMPGYEFKVVDAMITNFHVPRSTLLMLVSAFSGREHVMAAYEEAKRENYRFFSFGDAMLLL